MFLVFKKNSHFFHIIEKQEKNSGGEVFLVSEGKQGGALCLLSAVVGRK